MAYTILEEIGRGGMGSVFKARDEHGNIVAIKQMSNKVAYMPEYRELFNTEAETLQRLDHPSVVHIVGMPYGDSEGNLYLPMEYIDGTTLSQCIQQSGPFAVDVAVRLMLKVLEAMQYVHDHGRIHRDIKPSNIMLRPDGRVCVIDFGIAKDAKVGGTGKTAGRIIGTDGYMSPEQAKGLHIDHRTDIYSLGCVFFFMLTGRSAIKKESHDYKTVLNILQADMPVPSQYAQGVPPAIDQVFLRAVDRNMMQRFQSAAEFARALEAAASGQMPDAADTFRATGSNGWSQTPDTNSPVVTIGRGTDNDICYSSDYVSKHHLVVRGVMNNGAGSDQPAIEITDNSTNGTAVNGRPLRHSSILIPYTGTSFLPEVLLSARAEFPLNWAEVIALLRQRGWNRVQQPEPPQPQPPTPPAPNAPASANNQLLIAIIALLAIAIIIMLITR